MKFSYFKFFYRVGPGKFDIGDTTMTNFIDGYAILTKFDIRDGLVRFMDKFQKFLNVCLRSVRN